MSLVFTLELFLLMSSSVKTIKKYSPDSFPENRYVVFGGTFDPVHQGHLKATETLLNYFPLLILAPNTQNPWKENTATPLDLRVKMLQLALDTAKIPRTDNLNGAGVFIWDQGYVYAEELATALRKKRNGELFWAVGEDLADEVGQWRNWGSLQIDTVVVEISPEIHASDIREGKAKTLPAIRNFVQEHQLYSTKE